VKRIALVSYEGTHPTQRDDELLESERRRRGCDARTIAWSDPGAAWGEFDALVVRQPEGDQVA